MRQVNNYLPYSNLISSSYRAYDLNLLLIIPGEFSRHQAQLDKENAHFLLSQAVTEAVSIINNEKDLGVAPVSIKFITKCKRHNVISNILQKTLESLSRYLEGSRSRSPTYADAERHDGLENALGQSQIASGPIMSPTLSEDESNANTESENGACRL